MKKVLICLTFICLLFSIGCTNQLKPNQNINTTPINLSDLFPLKEGAMWEYEGEGNEYASFTREVIFTNQSLSQIKEDNGGTVSTSVFKTTPNEITRVFFKGEEYDMTNHLNSVSNDNTIILKSPIEVGTKWISNGQREIIDTNATANTPAGNFTGCIKVKITNVNSVLYEYFKKDVGMVKREFMSEDASITSSLKSYSLTK